MYEAFLKVREFHLRFGHPAPASPTLQSYDAARARAEWINSECDELIQASVEQDIAGQADAYLDVLYFALGGLVELGVTPYEIFYAVHAANMRKIHPDGSVKKRDDGKVIKPEGWYGPEDAIATAINMQAQALPLNKIQYVLPERS